MKKSHIWTIAMAFASLMNTPMAIEDDDLESLVPETKTIETEGKADLLAYFPETESEIRSLDSDAKPLPPWILP